MTRFSFPTLSFAALPFGLLVGLLLGTALVGVGYRGFDVLAALVVTLLGGLLSLWRWGQRALWAALAGLALLYGAALFTPLVPRALFHLTEAQAPTQADAVIVLGGGLDCEGRVMNAASAARLSRGIDLWRAGYADTLLLSSQSDALSPAHCPRLADLQSARLGGWFAAPPRVLRLRGVTDTADEAREAARLEKTAGWQRVLLVTSPSHSSRAAALFRSQLRAEVRSVPAEEWRFSVTGETAYDRIVGLNVVLYEYLSRLRALL